MTAESIFSILMVEDNALLRELYEAAIEELPIAVVGVAGGVEALELIDRQVFDLLVCDLHLGAGCNGDRVVRRFLEQQDGEVLVVSGSETLCDDLLARVSFLRKPFSIASFVNFIDKSLGRFRGVAAK